MPFIEVFDFEATAESRRKATESVTGALSEAYEISPGIITIYYIDASGNNYAHAGKLGDDAEKKRIFAKLHAMPRSPQMRGKAAKMLTRALAESYAAGPDRVSIYFCDRVAENAAHEGVLGT